MTGERRGAQRRMQGNKREAKIEGSGKRRETQLNNGKGDIWGREEGDKMKGVCGGGGIGGWKRES